MIVSYSLGITVIWTGGGREPCLSGGAVKRNPSASWMDLHALFIV